MHPVCTSWNVGAQPAAGLLWGLQQRWHVYVRMSHVRASPVVCALLLMWESPCFLSSASYILLPSYSACGLRVSRLVYECSPFEPILHPQVLPLYVACMCRIPSACVPADIVIISELW
jgi:hypothetical protein